jgi:8-oxo-dGTP diphosphatase
MTYVYHPPTLTVDCVIFQLLQNELHVLLIQRAHQPFKGQWALPGGYNAAGDTTMDALQRVLTTKVGTKAEDLQLIEQLYAFDTVARDPRGHAVSITYMGLVKDLRLDPPEGAHNPQFFPISKLPPLAYDHADIIKYAHERLRTRITSTSAIFALLPDLFTLTQLQSAYEAILGHTLDKRNFRKRFLSYDLVEPSDKYYQDGAHRPALLYRFKAQKQQNLVRSFD